jgi:hypothetical protein
MPITSLIELAPGVFDPEYHDVSWLFQPIQTSIFA